MNSNKLILAHDIISTVSKSNDLSPKVKNAYKINRLILDILTVVLQKWLEMFIINDMKLSVDVFFDQMIEGIEFLNKNKFKINNKVYNDIKKTLENVKKANKNKFPNDFSHFDITFCVSIMRNIIIPEINPKHGWLENYSQINLKNFNEADAFNYSRLIRNKFYGHTIGFEIEDKEFDVLKQQFN